MNIEKYLNKTSSKNKAQIVSLVNLILDKSELKSIGLVNIYKIHSDDLRAINISLNQAIEILNFINKYKPTISIKNDNLKNTTQKDKLGLSTKKEFSKFEINNIKDLEEYLILEIDRSGISKLKKISIILEPDSRNEKIEIFINQENGIYRYKNDETLSYKVKKERYIIISILKENGISTGPSLAETSYNGNMIVLTNAITAINKNFENKLLVKNPLIKHIPTGGYKINSDDYKIC